MSSMLRIRATLAQHLIEQIKSADYLEGLADDVRKLADGDETAREASDFNIVVTLYSKVEDFRKVLLADIRAANDLLKSQSGKTKEEDDNS